MTVSEKTSASNAGRSADAVRKGAVRTMSLLKWGLQFEEEPDTWSVVPCVELSTHGAHVMGYPFFDSHPTYKGKINWMSVEGGYFRGIP